MGCGMSGPARFTMTALGSTVSRRSCSWESGVSRSQLASEVMRSHARSVFAQVRSTVLAESAVEDSVIRIDLVVPSGITRKI
jgi:hypothetical protein